MFEAAEAITSSIAVEQVVVLVGHQLHESVPLSDVACRDADRNLLKSYDATIRWNLRGGRKADPRWTNSIKLISLSMVEMLVMT